MLKEMKEGRGPIYMDTVGALAKLRGARSRDALFALLSGVESRNAA